MGVKTVVTADRFTPDNAITTGRPVNAITLTVLNAPIVAQFSVADQKLNPSSFSFNRPEEPLIQGVWTFTRDDFDGFPLVGVQVRSQNPGVPATVTIRA